MRKLLLIGLILSLAIASLAQQKPDSPKLPVKRIILYSNGIGYFERQGTVNGSQNIELEFTSNQMNDVLKSLLLLDLNGGRIASATYNTAKPMEKQLERFTLNLNGSKGKSLTALIGQLVGTRIEVKTGANSIEGKVIGLETRQQQQTGSTIEVTSLVISSNDAMLQSFDLTEIRGIRILDAKIRTDLEQYLEILNTSHKKAARDLVIAAEGEGRTP